MAFTMKSPNTDHFRPSIASARRSLGPPWCVVIAAILVLALSLRAAPVITLRSEPVTVEDLSFYVRAGESDAFIVGQITQRKLVRGLTSKQEAVLKVQGASESLLQTLRDPRIRLSEADAVAFEKQRELPNGLPQIAEGPVREVRKVVSPYVVPVQVVQPVGVAVNTDDAGAATGVDLIVEKVTIQNPPPVPGPYYVWIQAQSGRAAVTFNIPNKAYGNEVATSDVEIPLNLRIRNVRLHDWATVKLQFDKQDKAVRTTAALKKVSARIEITKDPLEKDFSGAGDENDNFVYKLKWHAEEK